jgi:hypothetical protein
VLRCALCYVCPLVGVDVTTPSVVDVFVEPRACAQDGLVLRFISAGEAARPIEAVRYTSEDGRAGVWRVWAALDADATRREGARAVLVDRPEGQLMLVEGGTHGLLLEPEEAPSSSDDVVRVAYLLLDRGAIVR